MTTQQMTKPTSVHVAELALKIKALIVRLDELFTWASGWKSPIYNDNRKHLSHVENRSIIRKACIDIIKENNLDFNIDGILGTSLSGIPWAALLADYFQKTLYISAENERGEKKIYAFFYPPFFDASQLRFQNVAEENMIVTTAPWGVPRAVVQAFIQNRPFAYLRPEKKDHGLKKLIEGDVTKGEWANFHMIRPICKNTPVDQGPSYQLYNENTTQYVGATEGMELSFVMQSPVWVKEVSNLNNKKVFVMEDLISTGGSSLREVNLLRDYGAQVTDMIAIFSYGFPDVLQKFKDAKVRLHTILTYDELLPVAVEKGYIKTDELEELKKWNSDPAKWSQEHGGK